MASSTANTARIDRFGIQPDQLAEPLARGNAVELGVLLDGGDASASPGFEHGAEEGAAVGKSSVEAAFGDAEILGQNFNAHVLDTAARQCREPSFDPLGAAVVIGHCVRSTFLIRHRIDSA